MIAYRPACDGCSACVSVRIVVDEFAPSRGQRRIFKRNGDLVRGTAKAEATREQFALLRTYLDSRHSGGGMSDMGLFDYVAMVEETPVDTHLVEFGATPKMRRVRLWRARSPTCFATGCRWSTAFIIPAKIARSLGTHMILDHIAEAKRRGCLTCISATGSKAAPRWTTSRDLSRIEALRPEGWTRL